MSEPNFEKWPIDWDSLNKGDVIPVERLEQITETPRTSELYALKVLRFRHWLESEMKSRFRPVVTCSDHGALRILTDAEAVEYTAKRFQQAQNTMEASHRKAMDIDVGNLTDGEKRQHRQNTEVQAFVLLANRKALKQATKKIKAQAEDNALVLAAE